MTRCQYLYRLQEEQAFLYFHLKPMDEKQHSKWINHIFYLIKQSANQIFDEHEAQTNHLELELMKKSNECDALQNAVDSLETQLKPLVATCYKSCDTCKHEHENGTDYPCCDCMWRCGNEGDNYESKDF